MIRFLNLFQFIPFINRLIERKYYATGLGTYVLNSIFKVVFRINSGKFLFHFTSRATNTNKIFIVGDNKQSVYLSLATSGGCYYQAINGIEIGGGTIWSYNCSFISANHSFSDLKSHDNVAPIKIGNGVWLGSNVVVLPSVTIGSNSIIGAGSVVSKSIPDFAIAVGNPAKVIAMRCEKCLEKLPKESSVHEC
ncbi:acyltransferase [Patiriisocius sp. Uisw_047]|jgi:acetyltransferase-like isoleucine patch superfamily enzyme|uniref:acyltransferase n=1 Tax=Patiriisocius sp. Uisw_047 TaxID=3230969 RepID=UPI0039EBE498